MEVIGEYVIPDGWEAKGMNWNTPDPRNADYAMAIRQALFERCAATRWEPDPAVVRISPGKAVSRKAMIGAVETIWKIADSFVNMGWEEYEDDLSDFPRMWSYRDLVREPGCRLYEFAKYGSLAENGGEWLKQIRNAIDRLTVIRAKGAFSKVYDRAGAKHDPPFDESIGTAMQGAMSVQEKSVYDGPFPSAAYSWSGNTHWKCPDPDYEGSHPEDNVDGYCGYANSRAYRVIEVDSGVKDAEFDVFAAVIATEPKDPCGYSQVLEASVFDGGEMRLKKGLNWTDRIHAKDPCDVDLVIGDMESIPKNGIVPKSEFDGDGNPVLRRSAKRGWEGRVFGFVDYGVKGGFRFQAKED